MTNINEVMDDLSEISDNNMQDGWEQELGINGERPIRRQTDETQGLDVTFEVEDDELLINQ